MAYCGASVASRVLLDKHLGNASTVQVEHTLTQEVVAESANVNRERVVLRSVWFSDKQHR